MRIGVERAKQAVTVLAGPAGPTSENDHLSIARRIRRNFGIVFGGHAAAAVLGMVTLAINARVLGASGLGVLALIMTVGTTVDRVFAFQTWVPLIKLGSDALETGDRRRLGELTTISLLFDAVAALAASVSAVTVVILAGERLGIPSEYIGIAAIYMLALVTRLADTPAGLLRLFDRFSIITYIQLAGAALGCGLAVFLFLVAAPLSFYVLGYAALAVLTNLLLLASGLRVAIRSGFPLKLRDFHQSWLSVGREFWSFSWTTSLSGTIYVIRENAPVLLISSILGTAAVGIYHVATRIAGVLSLVMVAANHALYPDMARLATLRNHQELSGLVLRTGAYGAALGFAALILAVFWGPMLLSILAGNAYSAAYIPLCLLIIGHCFALAGVGLRSAVQVAVGPMALLRANLLPFLVFGTALPLLIIEFGIDGGAVAQIVFDVLALAFVTTQFLLWNRTVGAKP